MDIERREFILGMLSIPIKRQCAVFGSRVWLIGDSQGVVVLPFAKSLAQEKGLLLGGNPVGGASVISWALRHSSQIEWMHKRFVPDLVIVMLGTNDAFMGRGMISREGKFLDKLLTMLRMHGANVVWVGPPQLHSERLDLACDSFARLVMSRGITYLDSRRITVQLMRDGVHPTSSGRFVWARWIVDELMRFR